MASATQNYPTRCRYGELNLDLPWVQMQTPAPASPTNELISCKSEMQSKRNSHKLQLNKLQIMFNLIEEMSHDVIRQQTFSSELLRFPITTMHVMAARQLQKKLVSPPTHTPFSFQVLTPTLHAHTDVNYGKCSISICSVVSVCAFSTMLSRVLCCPLVNALRLISQFQRPICWVPLMSKSDFSIAFIKIPLTSFLVPSSSISRVKIP